MPVYEVTSPDGKRWQVNAPDGATQDQVLAYAKANFSAASAPQKQPAYDPTEGMSSAGLLAAGIGKGMVDLARGAGQRLGIVSQADVDAAKERDKALTDTTAGSVGNVVGKIAVGLPAVFVPGANTLMGAAAIGAGQGLLEPTATGESALKNAAIGGAGGAAGVAAGRLLSAGYQGAKGLVEPFFRPGQERIAGRVLARFAENPDALQEAVTRQGPSLTGSLPTLSEVSRDRGIASLERSLAQQDPRIAAALAQRVNDNNAARVARLQDLAGTEGERAFAAANRDATANALYDQAYKKGVNLARDASSGAFQSKATQAGIKGEITKLMQRPAIKEAMRDARTLAANEGVRLDSPAGSVKGLDYVKRALDDKISMADGNERRVLVELKNRLLTTVDRLSPDYAAARQVFAEMSAPINQMDIMQRVLDKASSATRDLSGNQRLQANAFARSLNDEAGLIKGATGFGGARELSDILSPQQMAALNAIRSELEVAANMASAANGPGSQTAKSLASQNLMRQLIGPTGMPQSWAESAMLRTALRPVQFAMNAAEPNIQNELLGAILDPARANALMRAAAPQQLNPTALALLPYLQQVGQQTLPAALVSR